MKTTAVIYNAASGSNALSIRDIKLAFGEAANRLIFLKISLGRDQLSERIKEYKVHQLVAAGGDGTVNLVANLCVEHGLPLGVLPVGTLNHFAKDLGLPIDLRQAADVIAEGATTRVDYCSVNDHVFVNNSSIGLYPLTVLKRQTLEKRLGKWPAALFATFQSVAELKTTRLRVTYTGHNYSFKTPLLFVGNNSYHLEDIGLTNRSSLKEGTLYLYIVRANKLSGIIRVAIYTVLGKRLKSHDFLAHVKHDLLVASAKKTLHVAVDGEVLILDAPLRYKVMPAGLTVCTPT